MDADHNATTRPVELTGPAEQIANAEQLINDVFAEAKAGGSGIISRRVTGPSGSGDHFEMKIPTNKVGLVIGKGGETIKSMLARTGARIQVIPLHLPPGDLSQERTLHIDGTSEQIKHARELVDEVISENRMRNQGMGGGGYPQQGYQARPPAKWAPSGAPMQQSSYGYMQPGQYPAPSPQYSMSQPPYLGYPPQLASGGYSAVPQNQQPLAGSGYDYYAQQTSQQQQSPNSSAAPTDNTSYKYGQGYNQQAQGFPQHLAMAPGTSLDGRVPLMDIEVPLDIEYSRADAFQHDLWPLNDIEEEKGKFPCCLVWTPLPVVSWLAPFIGHVGICREDGAILDFSGTNFVNVDKFAFGAAARYLQLDREKCCFPPNLIRHTCMNVYRHAEFGTALTWDDALQSSTHCFETKSYNLFTCNCHSFVANCLNRLCYDGSIDWNMVNVAALIFLKGNWVNYISIAKSFLPFAVVLCIGLAIVGWPFVIGLFMLSVLLLGWFLLGNYCYKPLVEC